MSWRRLRAPWRTLVTAMAEMRATLQRDLLAAIWSWPATPWPAGQFEALAARLYAFQVAHIPAYGHWAARRVGHSRPSSWQQLPLAPVAAFKVAPLATAEALAHPAAQFETSGTTDGRPGQVVLRDTALYDASLHRAFAHWMVPESAARNGLQFRCIALTPSASSRPRSSLGFMVRRLAQRWDDGGATEHLGAAGNEEALDVQGFIRACERASRDGVPAMVFATSVALHLLLEQLPRNWRVQLPAGSRLMDTGGPKGRHVLVARAEQHGHLERVLGLRPALIVGELGMTELCGQRYEATARELTLGQPATPRAYHGPPWLAARLLRVEDGAPCRVGEVGLVGHVDLSNLDTCAFLQTADLGTLDEYGGLRLLGRLPGSEWRGCGLDADDIVGAH